MKWLLGFCFYIVTFVSFSWQTDSCKCGYGPKCNANYTYQAVYNTTSGKATYGCVPQNACSKGVTNSCNNCCGTYTNCTQFYVIPGEPFSICNKCATGIVKTCDQCCTKYGYTCQSLSLRPFVHGPYICRAPQPKGYDCSSFCPVNSYCGILYYQDKTPYFYCLQDDKKKCY